ncbi:MAG TPA: 50S ribosomal protein L32 [Thermodesulfobacteriota bacterium]|nr:50S ribosomal protein L32 [Thermodesulfobacteriota bacterium]
MALPKRKTSRSKSRKRRTHYRISTPGLSLCPNCNELKSPHRACPNCGFYKGRTFKKESEE